MGWTMTPTITVRKDCCCVTDLGCNSDGYPAVRINGRVTSLHRVMYAELNGPIPEGKVVRHTCDNPACVNPNHLILGTHADNVKDRVDRGRSAIGERHGRHKLTRDDVLAIRHGSEGVRATARKYSVDPKAIRMIRQRKIWAWLPDED